MTFGQTIYCIAYILIVDFIVAGIIVTTLLWIVANRYLRQNAHEADIEWGYSFDVHMNAFFPPLVLLHFVQLIFFNGKFCHKNTSINWTHMNDLFIVFAGVINSDYFFSRAFGNTIWLIAILYYIYITFLGYNCEYFFFITKRLSNCFNNPLSLPFQVFLFWKIVALFWLQFRWLCCCMS